MSASAGPRVEICPRTGGLEWRRYKVSNPGKGAVPVLVPELFSRGGLIRETVAREVLCPERRNWMGFAVETNVADKITRKRSEPPCCLR